MPSSRPTPIRLAVAGLLAAILVAAGSGSRFGGARPKQFATLAGRPVLRHAAERLAPHVGLLQPVGDPAPILQALAGLPHLPAVPGGATRQASVRAGLEALAPFAPDVVLVHDAARPLFPPGTVDDLLRALRSCPGALPAAPVSDTLKRAVAGQVVATVPREGLHRAQTPQAFRFDVLLRLHRAAAPDGLTDDAALLEAAGLPVAVVPGSEDNIKLTYPEDLARMERLLAVPLQPRIGSGFDVHAFEAGRPLVLCGVAVPHEFGLAGHSDADVGLHALCDAAPEVPGGRHDLVVRPSRSAGATRARGAQPHAAHRPAAWRPDRRPGPGPLALPHLRR